MFLTIYCLSSGILYAFRLNGLPCVNIRMGAISHLPFVLPCLQNTSLYITGISLISLNYVFFVDKLNYANNRLVASFPLNTFMRSSHVSNSASLLPSTTSK